MLSPTLRRAIIQCSSHNIALPPTFLLPLRSNLSTAPTTTSPPSPAVHPYIPPQSFKQRHKSKASTKFHLEPERPTSPQNLTLSTPLPPALLPVLAAQPPHYITAHIHARPYLLTAGDTLRLPFYMANAPPGTILRLNRASSLGSRDYTFRGAPWIDESLFVCRARVVGVEGEPLRVIMKTKRRQRHIKRAAHKMRYTVLRCLEVKVLDGREEREEGLDEEISSASVTE